jgi:hypothetical protein
MVFGGTAARSSAIPTPTEGMTSYRTDTQQIESYDGAEWRGMSGLQLVKKQTIGTAVSQVDVTNCFSATYDNYLITVNGSVPSAGNLLSIRLGATATGYYSASNFPTYAGTTSVLSQNNATTWDHYCTSVSTTDIQTSFTLLSPFLSRTTIIQGWRISATGAGPAGGTLQNTTSYTGFSFFTSTGTITGGTICVYGYGT